MLNLLVMSMLSPQQTLPDICVPDFIYTRYFSTWQEAVCFLNESNKLNSRLEDMIMYNIKVRDEVRRMGIRNFLDEVLSIVGRDRIKQECIQNIISYWTNNPIADYDIQIYTIDTPITLMGHTFESLNSLRDHCEMYASNGYLYKPNAKFYVKKDEQYAPLNNIHVGVLKEHHFKYDSVSFLENYIFRPEPITEELMWQYLQMERKNNFCMVHESIPHELLPILHNFDDLRYMLLATPKPQPKPIDGV